MSGGARVSSGIGGGLKKTIQDIREIAGQHTDEDIYAMLKECSMDPNETIQRLLHLDTFHEVKKKHGRRKENVEIRAFDNLGQQQGARVGRGAKVGRGNFHSQKDNGRRNVGGSKENGFTNISKGPKSENKAAPQSSRSVHFEVIGENSQGGAPQENVDDINPAGHDLVPKILIPGKTCLPADGSKTLPLTLTPASFASKQETILSNGNHVNSAEPCLQPSFSSETVNLGAVFSCSNSVRDDQHAILNGDATWSNDKIQIDGPISCMPKNVDTANSQLTDCNGNGNGELQQADFAAKDVTFKETDNCVEEQFSSEEDTSVLNEEASKFNVSDGHVVFPGHLQVPEAYKTKLTFGSFDCCWSVDGKQTSGGNGMNTDTQIDDSNLVNTVVQSSIESGVISTVKDAQEIEDPSHLQSPPPVSENTPLAEHPSSDVVIKIDEPEAESRLRNGGPGLANHSSNYIFGYAPHGQLQTHDSTESQGGGSVASSISNMDQSSRTQPSGIAHDMASSPPPAPLLRQTYHPNFFPYGHYYPQFFVPQVQQYITHGGFSQHPSVANVYITSAAAGAAGIKYSHQQQKQGSNAGTDDYIGVPSGYSPYVSYAFPYGLPPVVVPGNVTVDDDHATQSKENTTTHMTDQQIESPGEWMAGTGRTISGMQVNPFYNLAPGQGHPMVFPSTPAGFGGFGGVYHPAAAQTIPAPQPTVHPYIHQPQAMGSAEAGVMPPAGFYQQQPQGAPIIWNSKQ